MKIRFIGDVHGKVQQYIEVLDDEGDYDYSIQVGDMGIGFVNFPTFQEPIKDFFIRGNHDNPEICKLKNNYIQDGHYDDQLSMMFVGGADSINKAWRTIGIDWWDNEQCSFDEFTKIYDNYEFYKPRVMVTHDCPQSIVQHLNMRAVEDQPLTRQALQAMLEVHRPELWVMGHWHKSLDITIDGTRFICLNELEWKDIEL